MVRKKTMFNSVKAVKDSSNRSMIGVVQKGPAPARGTNPRGVRKDRVLSMQKGDWFVDDISQIENWRSAGASFARGSHSCYKHPQDPTLCVFEIIK